MMQRALSCTTLLLVAILSFTNFGISQRETNAKRPAEQGVTPQTPQAADSAKQEKEKKEGDPLFKGMKYRSIGPFRGGRSLTASGIPGDPTTYYFGATGGGVWKSTDGATSWSPVFDKDG